MAFDTQLTDPTAGVEAGSDAQVTDTQAATQTPAAEPRPTARSYTDADLAGLRRSERTRYERELQRQVEAARAEWEQQARSQSQPQLDPQAEAVLRQYIEQSTAPLAQQFEDMTLERSIERAKAKYPDFDESSVLQFARDHGLGKNDDLTFDQILDLAYRNQKFEAMQSPDAKSLPKNVRDAVIAEYLASKKAQAGTTPRPEGQGGSAPVSTNKVKSFKDADAVLRDAIRRSREHEG